MLESYSGGAKVEIRKAGSFEIYDSQLEADIIGLCEVEGYILHKAKRHCFTIYKEVVQEVKKDDED